MEVKSFVVLEWFYNNQLRVGHIFSPHYQTWIKIDLFHLIENRYVTFVPVVAASKTENDTEAVRTHRLISSHAPTPNVVASTVELCARLMEWFYACPTVKGCPNLKSVHVTRWCRHGFECHLSQFLLIFHWGRFLKPSIFALDMDHNTQAEVIKLDAFIGISRKHS